MIVGLIVGGCWSGGGLRGCERDESTEATIMIVTPASMVWIR